MSKSNSPFATWQVYAAYGVLEKWFVWMGAFVSQIAMSGRAPSTWCFAVFGQRARKLSRRIEREPDAANGDHTWHPLSVPAARDELWAGAVRGALPGACRRAAPLPGRATTPAPAALTLLPGAAIARWPTSTPPFLPKTCIFFDQWLHVPKVPAPWRKTSAPLEAAARG